MTYTVAGTGGCSNATTTLMVTVKAIETPNFDLVGPICLGSPIILTNTSKNGIAGTWTPTTDNTATKTYTFTPDAGQCANTNTMTVIVNVINAKVNDPLEILAGDSVKLESTGGITYLWTNGSSLSCNNCPTPTAKPSSTTQYCVFITDQNGCTDTKCTEVKVDESCTDVFIPSMFSPNGDSHNDYLEVEGSCIITFDLRIYNRWGELVFQSKDQTKSWDGKYKDKALNSNVFAYVFEYTDKTNKSHKVSGNITLIK
jgi:gliding motility-associated-like protein